MNNIRLVQIASLLLSLFNFPSSNFARAQCAPDTLVQSIPNPGTGASDQFGLSVAVSADLAVVGAFRDNAGAGEGGSVYVYNAMTGTLSATLLNPSPALRDRFGQSVAISVNVAVVGVPWDDIGANHAGSAYVFNATTGALVARLNNPTPAESDLFGWSVAVSGSVAVVGAYQDDAGVTNGGTVYVFNATTGALTATLNNPAPATGDVFGVSVAVSGNLAIVGASGDDLGMSDVGAAYVFNATTGVLVTILNNPAPSELGLFGNSVAISGNVAVVGAYYEDVGANNAGTAYVFDATTGALVAPLNNPAPAPGDHFGVSVAVSGNVVLVGAYSDGAGAPTAGTAYMFNTTNGALLATLNNPAPAASDQFGNSVALSGNVAVVAAYQDDEGTMNAGSVYVYNCIPTPHESILAYLLGYPTDPAGLDLNADGTVDIADLIHAGL